MMKEKNQIGTMTTCYREFIYSWAIALAVIAAACSTQGNDPVEQNSLSSRINRSAEVCVDDADISHACHHTEDSPTQVNATGCNANAQTAVLDRDHTHYNINFGNDSLGCLTRRASLPLVVGGSNTAPAPAPSAPVRVGVVKFSPPAEIQTWISKNTQLNTQGQRVAVNSVQDVPEWVLYLRSTDASMHLSITGEDASNIELECQEPINAQQCPGLNQANRYIVPATAGTLTLKFVTGLSDVGVIFEEGGHEHTSTRR